MEISIRPYSEADFSAVMDLFRCNSPAYFSPEEEPDLADYLQFESELYYVAIAENKLVGCGGINFDADGITARISWDMIHPDLHGKGIGSSLVRHRIEEVRRHPQIRTLLVRTSQFAWKFYARQGFELRETEQDYWARGFDLYLMEMKL